ncbi:MULTISPECIES: hypothetical protein [unclassified Rhodococcus (in: high G+C Gram-positive bacteria)]|uniref:hypothetical protein n=1 Tax=unclassified Rhodococcus (in: high G+C Gram-positive bacteria) TaxID=192944 RepID=UPI00163970F2|nr:MULTISPECIES: hypothetical protein [unclassified Rhodococcus (in: high G+C Gram-positive bacteria)]MBC2644732.1 hypothetical protein [Rhodococcus sp. 3A]MBC2898327.1 hypothetical protein [Rhodococcus sp. 4CII]
MGRQSGIFAGCGLVVGVVAVVVFAAFTSRPYMVATSLQPGLTDPSVVAVVVLVGAAMAGAGCGMVLWLSGWRVVRDAASADERRRRRTFLLGRTVAAALAGITVGLSPMLVLLYAVFTATVGIAVEWAVVLVLYAGSAVLAYGCALLGVWWVLAGSGDDRRAGTVRMLAVLLPVGALAATAAGVGAAGLFGYSTVPATFVCVITVVAAVLTATVALARMLTRDRAPAAGTGTG